MVKNSDHVIARSGSRRRQPVSFDQIRQWARDSRNELRKVTWPTPEQTRNLTLVVLAVCVLMACFLGIVDFLLGLIVRFLVGY